MSRKQTPTRAIVLTLSGDDEEDWADRTESEVEDTNVCVEAELYVSDLNRLRPRARPPRRRGERRWLERPLLLLLSAPFG